MGGKTVTIGRQNLQDLRGAVDSSSAQVAALGARNKKQRKKIEALETEKCIGNEMRSHLKWEIKIRDLQIVSLKKELSDALSKSEQLDDALARYYHLGFWGRLKFLFCG